MVDRDLDKPVAVTVLTQGFEPQVLVAGLALGVFSKLCTAGLSRIRSHSDANCTNLMVWRNPICQSAGEILPADSSHVYENI